MIPARFVVEFPRRCLDLIDVMEPEARRLSLLGSFSLMIAPSLFLVPFERMKNSHPLGEADREPEIVTALKRIDRQDFLGAEFWQGNVPTDWRLSRVISDVESSYHWQDRDGVHPMAENAQNEISKAGVGKVIRVIRNALAHGNVIYLDEKGLESKGALVQHLAFLSRYEEGEEQRKHSETYRLLTVTEEGFLCFLRCWAGWLQQFHMDSKIQEAA